MTWRAVARLSERPGLTERSPVRVPVGARSSMTPSGVGLERWGGVGSFVIAVVSGAGAAGIEFGSSGPAGRRTAGSVKGGVADAWRTGVHRERPHRAGG